MTQIEANSKVNLSGQCECGRVKWNASAQPLARVYCHCTICQEFNQSDHADILIFKHKQIDVVNEAGVDYKKMKRLLAVDRGVCSACKTPIVEQFKIPILPQFTFVPTATTSAADLPKSQAHLFYHRRQRDWNDDVDKYSSAFSSHLGSLKLL